MIKTNLKIRRRKRKSSYADTMESTEPRLGFTLDRAFCSFSRNSFLFLLESLPPSGLPELYMVAILLSRMNRIQLLETLLSFRSRPHRTTPASCRRGTPSNRHPGSRHRYHQTTSPCQGYRRTHGTFLNCHAYLIGINFPRHNPHKMFTLSCMSVLFS